MFARAELFIAPYVVHRLIQGYILNILNYINLVGSDSIAFGSFLLDVGR